MAEKPQKRRMSSFGSDEPTIPSLTREVEYMQRQHVAITREHSVIQNRYMKNKAVASGVQQINSGVRTGFSFVRNAFDAVVKSVQEIDEELLSAGVRYAQAWL